MNGIKIMQVRWPIELYEWLQDTAYTKRKSINKTVIELIESAKTQEQEIKK